MPDQPNQLIWIPVSSGKSTDSAESEACNVQFDSRGYPSPVPEAPICMRIIDTFGFESALNGAAQLLECYARWEWATISVDGNVTEGAQLAIGAPFSRIVGPFGTPTARYANVQVFAKIRVNDPADFYRIYISINDSASHLDSSGDKSGSFTPGNWSVIDHPKSGGWTDPENWDNENLRVVLTFLGPFTQSGSVCNINQVDVEWIAIYLSGDEI